MNGELIEEKTWYSLVALIPKSCHWKGLVKNLRFGSNRQKLSEQVDEAVQLAYHAYDRPSQEYEDNASKEGDNALDTIRPWEEAHSPRDSNGQSEAQQKENVAQGQHCWIKKE